MAIGLPSPRRRHRARRRGRAPGRLDRLGHRARRASSTTRTRPARAGARHRGGARNTTRRLIVVFGAAAIAQVADDGRASRRATPTWRLSRRQPPYEYPGGDRRHGPDVRERAQAGAGELGRATRGYHAEVGDRDSRGRAAGALGPRAADRREGPRRTTSFARHTQAPLRTTERAAAALAALTTLATHRNRRRRRAPRQPFPGVGGARWAARYPGGTRTASRARTTTAAPSRPGSSSSNFPGRARRWFRLRCPGRGLWRGWYRRGRPPGHCVMIIATYCPRRAMGDVARARAPNSRGWSLVLLH